MTTKQILEALSVFADYIEHYYSQCRERDNVLNKLQEAVFWLTYISEDNEEV